MFAKYTLHLNLPTNIHTGRQHMHSKVPILNERRSTLGMGMNTFLPLPRSMFQSSVF